MSRKILIIGNLLEFNELYNFTGIYTYYIYNKLKEKEFDVEHLKIMDPEENSIEQQKNYYDNYIQNNIYDDIIFISLRHFNKVDNELYYFLKRKVNGNICQIHDGARDDLCDINFSFKEVNPEEKNLTCKNISISWAADLDVFYPEKSNKTLVLLMDHLDPRIKGEEDGKVEKSIKIYKEIKRLHDLEIYKNFQWENIILYQLTVGNLRQLNLENENLPRELYYKGEITYENLSKWINTVHLFFTTHKETVGQMVLESAMSGALPVLHEKHLHEDRLKTIPHHIWKKGMDWNKILNNLDSENIRKESSQENTWDDLIERIIKGLYET